jgi:N-acetyl sugar amidotransferase
MRFCKHCVEPDTRPDCIFDDEGVCYPCRYHETLHEVDWAARRHELEQIAAWCRENTRSGYDCIVPVSGGKDSTRQALYMRDELGMRPLLVSLSYPPEHQTERGAANLDNLIRLGFDTYVISPGPQLWKRLMRIGFYKFGNMYKSTELPLYASAPRIAIAYGIPMIVYGENPALSWGSAGGSLDGDANRLKYNNTLKGGDLSPYLEDGIPRRDLYWYVYPSDEEIERADLRMIYLGYYIPDFYDFVNGRVALENGLTRRHGIDARPEDNGHITPFDALDDDFVMINQMLKHLKFGFGKVTEQVSGAIRSGYLNRERGIDMVRRYDGRCADRFIRRFCEYIEISVEEFWRVAEGYRNPDVWERDEHDAWVLKYAVFHDTPDHRRPGADKQREAG